MLARLSTVDREIESTDDRWYLTRVLPYRALGDVIEGVVLTFIDITERKRAERDLQRNQQLLQTVIDNSPNPINVMRGSDLRIIMSNQAHETLTRGRSVLGKTLDEIWTELDYDFSALCRRVLKSGEPCCRENECFEIRRTPQGPLEPRWFTFWLVPVDLPGETEKGLLNTAHEVTESVAHEKALREAKAQLEDADRRKDEFLATLAHELRNPLAPIRTGVELLKMLEDPAEREDIRATMERQAEQMIVLIDDLMDVSRITRGKVCLRKHPVVLHEIVRNAVEATRPLIDEAGHTLTVQQPEEIIHLEADPHRLAQVLSNLLSNAARYTPNGGQITIVVRPRDFEAVVEVSDNGRGIPREKLAQIFEMFAQVDHGSKQGGKGLGIGLTLARSLVEMHGGSIEVESVPRWLFDEHDVALLFGCSSFRGTDAERYHDAFAMLRERHLAELGRHAQQGGDPHPEEGAGPAPVDGDRHARDVADADGRRERRRERLEVRHVARLIGIVVLARGDGEPVAEAAELDEAEAHGEPDAHAQQRDDDQRNRLAADGNPELPDGEFKPFDDTLKPVHTPASARWERGAAGATRKARARPT